MGEFQRATEIAGRIRAVAEDYDNDASLVYCHEILTRIYSVRRDTQAAIQEADRLIALSQRIGIRSVKKLHLARKLQPLLIEGDFEEAEKLVEEIQLLIEEDRVFIAVQVIPPLMSMVSYYTLRLSDERDPRKKKTHRKRMKPLLKKLVKKGKKIAIHHSEACRVAGTAFWILGRQRRALAFWQEGLREADQVGWRVEAGRLAMEIGRRLSEPGSHHKTLDGKSPEHYLLRAKETFTDLRLERDLAEVERIGL